MLSLFWPLRNLQVTARVQVSGVAVVVDMIGLDTPILIGNDDVLVQRVPATDLFCGPEVSITTVDPSSAAGSTMASG